jgi:hypothetical protein
MKNSLLFALCLHVLNFLAMAADGPIRALFLGHESEHHNSAASVPMLMQRFGREAIYFDYYTKPDCLTADTLGALDEATHKAALLSKDAPSPQRRARPWHRCPRWA